MAYDLSRIDRVPRTFDINARETNGNPAVLATIQFALTTPRAHVTAATAWITVTATAITPAPTAAQPALPTHEATVIYTGPEATAQANDLVISLAGNDLHMKRTDGSYVDSERVERISVR